MAGTSRSADFKAGRTRTTRLSIARIGWPVDTGLMKTLPTTRDLALSSDDCLRTHTHTHKSLRLTNGYTTPDLGVADFARSKRVVVV